MVRASSTTLFQLAREEIGRFLVSLGPTAVKQEVVNIVRKDELLDFYVSLPERLHEIHRFRKRNVAIVVSVNDENWRPPSIDRRHRRRLKSETRKIFAFSRIVCRREISDDDIPIMDTVQVDASLEEV